MLMLLIPTRILRLVVYDIPFNLSLSIHIYIYIYIYIYISVENTSAIERSVYFTDAGATGTANTTDTTNTTNTTHGSFPIRFTSNWARFSLGSILIAFLPYDLPNQNDKRKKQHLDDHVGAE